MEMQRDGETDRGETDPGKNMEMERVKDGHGGEM